MPVRQSSPGRAIGGVFPLEDASAPPQGGGRSIWDRWTGDAAAAYGFRNARSALRHILTSLQPARLWLPAYSCADILQAALGLKLPILFFPASPGLHPETGFLRNALKAHDAVLGINYFGRPADAAWRRLVQDRPDVVWVEDCAQSAETGAAHCSGLRIFSPRKILGVADGGLLVDTDGVLPAPVLRTGSSALLRHPYLLRRSDPADRDNETWFRAFQRAEAAMTISDCAMTTLSTTALQRIELASITEPRIRNYAILNEGLAQFALFSEPTPVWAPLGFPMRSDRAGALCAKLAEHRIYAPRHWQTLATPKPPTIEHDLSRHILTLPCDQRYGESDMERVVRVVRDFLR